MLTMVGRGTEVPRSVPWGHLTHPGNPSRKEGEELKGLHSGGIKCQEDGRPVWLWRWSGPEQKRHNLQGHIKDIELHPQNNGNPKIIQNLS